VQVVSLPGLFFVALQDIIPLPAYFAGVVITGYKMYCAVITGHWAGAVLVVVTCLCALTVGRTDAFRVRNASVVILCILNAVRRPL
jgi:hypothetical protein